MAEAESPSANCKSPTSKAFLHFQSGPSAVTPDVAVRRYNGSLVTLVLRHGSSLY